MTPIPHSPTTTSRQRGLTLVELMIALVLSLMLMAGVATMFEANKRTYVLQDGFSRLQENGRFALNAILRDLRGAGYNGCSSSAPTVLANTLSATPNAGIYPIDNFHAAMPVDGFEGGTGSTWTPTLSSKFTGGTAPGPLPGTDVLSIRLTDVAAARVTAHGSATADLTTVGFGDLAAPDIAAVSDCRDVSIFRIAGVTSGGVVTPAFTSGDLGKRFTNGEVARLIGRSYFIDTGASGDPALFRQDLIGNAGGTTFNVQELVDGIEDLEILYGQDTNADGIPDVYVTAQTIDAAAAWPNVLSVRIALMARTRGNATNQAQAYTPLSADPGDSPSAVTANDGRIRQAFVATVALRNKLL